MTLLSISRKELGGKPVDLTTIEQPSYANSDTIDLIFKMAPEILDHLKVKPYLIPDSTLTAEDYDKGLSRDQWLSGLPFHFTTKSGPNGPALTSALEDYLALPQLLKDHLVVLEPRLAPIFGVLESYNVRTLARVMRELVSRPEPSERKLRKLSVKKDKEGKSRVFAILDYFSQAALKGLHDHLFQVIKTIPTDCSFDQLSGLSLREVEGLKVSADLTAATDRFPISLQQKILGLITNEEFSASWNYTMVGLPFSLEGKSITYRAGQPMGAHSSWAVFALCHHVVVQAAAKLELGRYAVADDYRLLGDDIVLVGDAFAKRYISLMSELGVEINDSKTHSSERMFEFAKRLIVDRIEVSAYPLDGLVRSSKFYLLASFLVEQVGRGYPLPPVRGPGSIESAIGLTIGTYRSRLVRQLTTKAFDWIWMTRFITTHSDPAKQYFALNQWAKHKPYVVIPCRTTLLGITPVLKWAGMLLYKAFGSMVKSDSDQVARHYAVWRGALMLLSSSLEGWSQNPTLRSGPLSLSSGTGSFSLLGVVPVLGSVARLALETAETSSGVPKLTKVDLVYPMINNLQMTMLPSLTGVNPLRKRDIILGTRAEFSRRVRLEFEAFDAKFRGANK